MFTEVEVDVDVDGNSEGLKGAIVKGALPGAMTLRTLEGDMDFSIVIRQIKTAYFRGDFLPWLYPDFIRVFERFYGLYCTRRARWHPALKTTTIARVMALLVEDDNGVRYSPEDYLETDIFDAYFETRFNEGCDYSIVHFTSGDIRRYKSYEAVI